MSETLKLQRNASIYTKRRQMRKAATRTVQVGVSCFGARQTGLASTGRGRRAGWGPEEGESKRENGTNRSERGERGRRMEGGKKKGRERERSKEREREKEREIDLYKK